MGVESQSESMLNDVHVIGVCSMRFPRSFIKHLVFDCRSSFAEGVVVDH